MLKSYAFDVFVWICIAIPVVLIIFVLLKRKLVFIRIFGVIILLTAIPIGALSEVSISGCCGGQNTRPTWLGYLIGGVVAAIGILIIVFSKKLAKK